MQSYTRIQLTSNFTPYSTDEVFEKLRTAKASGNQHRFNAILNELLIPVKHYLEEELVSALKRKLIPEGKYEVNEILDQLFLDTYDAIHNVDTGQHIMNWLFRRADEMLEEIVIEEEFNHYYFENIDVVLNREISAMEENITRDGDGDLVLIEELDDLSYPKYQYKTEDIFVTDNQDAVIEEIDKNLKDEAVQYSISHILRHLPSKLRSVYNLHTAHGMDVQSISYIKRMTEIEVEEMLALVRQQLKQLLDSNIGDFTTEL